MSYCNKEIWKYISSNQIVFLAQSPHPVFLIVGLWLHLFMPPFQHLKSMVTTSVFVELAEKKGGESPMDGFYGPLTAGVGTSLKCTFWRLVPSHTVTARAKEDHYVSPGKWERGLSATLRHVLLKISTTMLRPKTHKVQSVSKVCISWTLVAT